MYVDGTYRGQVSPWGDDYVNVGAGNTKVYIVAEFTDGSRVTWGPVTRSCYDQFDLTIREGSYTYQAR
ncbi:hypothetical protein [Cesiribacter andamanensis]|uniref:Uncharacterized protein n=1 Tax=Cesiribacter andamanensis AMV16 TaxID=1279009 RepID=M7NNB5_9BACT|nr:hypothetical protein [Cesiribacter andamanensis]EMR03220.1 hypothetical protein ADICEAN_01613 [Cesiribacter andamanensis AMV16]